MAKSAAPNGFWRLQVSGLVRELDAQSFAVFVFTGATGEERARKAIDKLVAGDDMRDLNIELRWFLEMPALPPYPWNGT